MILINAFDPASAILLSASCSRLGGLLGRKSLIFRWNSSLKASWQALKTSFKLSEITYELNWCAIKKHRTIRNVEIGFPTHKAQKKERTWRMMTIVVTNPWTIRENSLDLREDFWRAVFGVRSKCCLMCCSIRTLNNHSNLRCSWISVVSKHKHPTIS